MDGREMLLQEGLARWRGVEPHMVEAVLLHLEVDRAGDDVARRQFHASSWACMKRRAVGQQLSGAPSPRSASVMRKLRSCGW